MRTLHIQDETGDTTVDLDEQFDLATELFQKALTNGSWGYAYYEGEKSPVVIHDANEMETAVKVVVTPRQVGG